MDTSWAGDQQLKMFYILLGPQSVGLVFMRPNLPTYTLVSLSVRLHAAALSAQHGTARHDGMVWREITTWNIIGVEGLMDRGVYCIPSGVKYLNKI